MGSEKLMDSLLVVAVTLSLLFTSIALGTSIVNAAGRDPIIIEGNEGFTVENGVTGGTGTPGNPYVIEGWEISYFSGSAGISIRNTTAYYIVRNVQITANPQFSEGISLYNTSRGTLQDIVVLQGRNGILAESCSDLQIINVTSTADYLNWAHCAWLKRCSDVIIRDCNFSFARGGLWMERCSRITVDNTTVNSHNGGVPVYSWLSDHITLLKCNISNNEDGIMVEETPYFRMVDNVVANNPGYGLVLRASPYAGLYTNSFTGCGVSVQGSSVEGYNSHDIPTNNSVNGAPLLYFKDEYGIILDAEPVGQVIVANCYAMWFSNLTIASSTVGIQVSFSSEMIIDTCQITDQSLYGVYAWNCADMVVWSVTTDNCWQGIDLEYCPSAVVMECYINNSEQCALSLNDCPDAMVVTSSMVSADVGISIFRCENLTVAGNYLESCYWDGLAIGESDGADIAGNVIVLCEYWGGRVDSASVTFEDNIVAGCYYGVEFGLSSDCVIRNNTFEYNWDGLLLSADTQGCEVYHNNFIENPASDDGSGNSWDDGYPSGGNYWDSLTVPDQKRGASQNEVGPDGIVDTNMPISAGSAGSVDRYPLTDPWNENAPPHPWIQVDPDYGNITTEFAFNASLSFDREDPVTALQFAWDWDSDGVVDTQWSNDSVTMHSFETPGTYVIRLYAMDSEGAEDYVFTTLNVLDLPPTAEAGVNQTVDQGSQVTFNGTASTDNNGVTNYTWKFVYAGRTIKLYGVSPVWTFNESGVFEVNLTVEDDFGMKDWDTFTITVEKSPGRLALADYWWAVAVVLAAAIAGVAVLVYFVTRRKKNP